MKVSEDTVRRDLRELANAGKLIKVHGGALSGLYEIHTPLNTTPGLKWYYGVGGYQFCARCIWPDRPVYHPVKNHIPFVKTSPGQRSFFMRCMLAGNNCRITGRIPPFLSQFPLHIY